MVSQSYIEEQPFLIELPPMPPPISAPLASLPHPANRVLAREEFELRARAFISTDKGRRALERYRETCDVKPRNIYTDRIDFIQRYQEESYLLYRCLALLAVSRADLLNLYQEIPELESHYSWLLNIDFVRDSSKMEFLPAVGRLLTEFFGAIDQRTYGEYYSPLEMIRLAFKMASLRFHLDDKVVDPSCGAGFFLYAYVERLISGHQIKSMEDLRKLRDNLHGFDIFPCSIIVSKLLIGELLRRTLGERRGVYSFPNILVKNTLQDPACGTSRKAEVFDVVIGNPPFFRIDPKHDNRLCRCISYGHNYSHALFLHWSIRSLRQDGRLCLFLPQSMLSGFYYQKIRKELLDRCWINLLITNKQHEDTFLVQQDIIILTATKGKSDGAYYRIGTSSKDYTSVRSFPVPLALTGNSLQIIPAFKSREELAALRRLAQSPVVPLLAGLKLSTGNFVWNQNKERCLPKPSRGTFPLISGPNVTLGGVRLQAAKSQGLSYCIPPHPKYIKTGTAIVSRRMSPIGNARRFVAAIIHEGIAKRYVIENHVNVISNGNDLAKLKPVLKFLLREEFNLLLDAFCHTNQVSTNELRVLFEALAGVRATTEA